MKTANLITLTFTLLFGLNLVAQQDPDQNPNYMESQSKYMEEAKSLNATQGTTVQDTYEAFDWTEYKAAKKQDRRNRRNDRYKMRYNYNNNGQYNNGSYYNNNGYNNNNGYYNNNNNNGYYNNNSGYNNSPSCGSNGLYNSILLGATLYSLFN